MKLSAWIVAVLLTHCLRSIEALGSGSKRRAQWQLSCAIDFRWLFRIGGAEQGALRLMASDELWQQDQHDHWHPGGSGEDWQHDPWRQHGWAWQWHGWDGNSNWYDSQRWWRNDWYGYGNDWSWSDTWHGSNDRGESMSHRDDRDCFDETGHRRESGLTSTAERLASHSKATADGRASHSQGEVMKLGQEDAGQNSQGGGSNVSSRTREPKTGKEVIPSWSGDTPFRDYKRRVDLFLATSGLDPEYRAGRLVEQLSEAAWRATSTLDVSQL